MHQYSSSLFLLHENEKIKINIFLNKNGYDDSNFYVSQEYKIKMIIYVQLQC